ncbi:MAG: T9SS type A sorting domain-containing protein, partial [Bacteroidales bacterium]|nr:T9SS type A sorting domain-containing protein [Bacteroidales bacterium]
VTSDPSATITLTTTGINDYELNNVVVYPNPTTGMIQIQNSESRIENVEVYDAYGKMLNVVNVNDNTTAVDLSNYAAGTYFVRVMTDKGVVTKRVVKN